MHRSHPNSYCIRKGLLLPVWFHIRTFHLGTRAAFEKKIDRPKKPETRITNRKSARSHVLLVPAFFSPVETTLEGVLCKIRILFLKKDLP